MWGNGASDIAGRVRRRQFGWIPVIALVLLLTAGCARVSFQSTFNEDGTATHAIAATFPRDEFERAAEGRAGRLIDTLNQRAESAGLDVDRALTAESVTVRISTTTANRAEVGGALNSLINATGATAEPGINAPFIGNFQQEKGAIGGGTFELDLTVDGELLFDGLYSLAQGVRPGLTKDELDAGLTMDYVVSLPGTVEETNGERIDSNTVRWEIPNDRTIELHAISSKASDNASTLFILGGVTLLAVAIGIGVLAGLFLVRRRRFTAHLALISTRLPRGSTVTTLGIWVSLRLRGIAERLWRRGGRTEPSPIHDEILDDEEAETHDGTQSKGA